MLTRRLILFLLPFACLSLLLPCLSFSAPYYGANFSYVLVAREPPTSHGFQLMATYDPQRFQWKQFNVYFDGGISHFWVNNTPYYSTLTIYSAAPVVRYSFEKRGAFLPYFELSIGPAYLNHTHFEDRKLGIHFSFQDRAGIGVLIGEKEQLSLGLHAVHYSNAHLSQHNSGVTLPLMLDVGYRFQ